MDQNRRDEMDTDTVPLPFKTFVSFPTAPLFVIFCNISWLQVVVGKWKSGRVVVSWLLSPE